LNFAEVSSLPSSSVKIQEQIPPKKIESVTQGMIRLLEILAQQRMKTAKSFAS
jgi:hypothetical protein